MLDAEDVTRPEMLRRKKVIAPELCLNKTTAIDIMGGNEL
jgi:hypothetical protein